jgi:hypothetical protein
MSKDRRAQLLRRSSPSTAGGIDSHFSAQVTRRFPRIYADAGCAIPHWPPTQYEVEPAQAVVAWKSPWRYRSQFSTLSAGTRLNSATLSVTHTASIARACAAISMSCAPIRAPFFSNATRIAA